VRASSEEKGLPEAAGFGRLHGPRCDVLANTKPEGPAAPGSVPRSVPRSVPGSTSAAAASPAATSSIPRKLLNVPETAPSSRPPPTPRPSATGPAGFLQPSQPPHESLRQVNHTPRACTQPSEESGRFTGLAAPAAATISRAMISSSSSSVRLPRKLSSASAVSHRPILRTPRCMAHARFVDARLMRDVRTRGCCPLPCKQSAVTPDLEVLWDEIL
jgi:hypothetical protein